MRLPYIGITGFASPEDVTTAEQCAALVPRGWRFMAGVLVSAKTLRGEDSPRRRYPPLPSAAGLVRHLAAVAWPVVHFNTRATGEDLARELRALGRGLPEARGLQLNVVRPDPAAVAAFRREFPGVEVVLQVNRASLDAASPNVSEIDDYVAAYDGLAEHALLDLSGGAGVPLDLPLARDVVRGWMHAARPGVAGGLDAASVRQLEGLAVSCDAESRVRTAHDSLDHGRALAYVRAAVETLVPAIENR